MYRMSNDCVITLSFSYGCNCNFQITLIQEIKSLDLYWRCIFIFTFKYIHRICKRIC